MIPVAGIDDLSEDVYRVEHSDSEDSDKSDSSDSEYLSDEEQKPRIHSQDKDKDRGDRESKKRSRNASAERQEKNGGVPGTAAGMPGRDKPAPDGPGPAREKHNSVEKEAQEKQRAPQHQRQQQQQQHHQQQQRQQHHQQQQRQQHHPGEHQKELRR